MFKKLTMISCILLGSVNAAQEIDYVQKLREVREGGFRDSDFLSKEEWRDTSLTSKTIERSALKYWIKKGEDKDQQLQQIEAFAGMIFQNKINTYKKFLEHVKLSEENIKHSYVNYFLEATRWERCRNGDIEGYKEKYSSLDGSQKSWVESIFGGGINPFDHQKDGMNAPQIWPRQEDEDIDSLAQKISNYVETGMEIKENTVVIIQGNCNTKTGTGEMEVASTPNKTIVFKEQTPLWQKIFVGTAAATGLVYAGYKLGVYSGMWNIFKNYSPTAAEKIATRAFSITDTCSSFYNQSFGGVQTFGSNLFSKFSR